VLWEQQEGMSETTLDTVWQIWSIVLLYTVVTSALCYFVAGLICCVTHLTSWSKRLLICGPVLAAVIGCVIALCVTVVPTALLAAVYVSTPTSMSRFPGAAAWGISQGVFVALFNAKVFSRII
jgi:Putative transmembrane protein 170